MLVVAVEAVPALVELVELAVVAQVLLARALMVLPIQVEVLVVGIRPPLPLVVAVSSLSVPSHQPLSPRCP